MSHILHLQRFDGKDNEKLEKTRSQILFFTSLFVIFPENGRKHCQFH